MINFRDDQCDNEAADEYPPVRGGGYEPSVAITEELRDTQIDLSRIWVGPFTRESWASLSTLR